MPAATAVVRYLRMTPRKVNYVLLPLRRRSVSAALTWLSTTNRRAAKPVAKLLASAFANARQRDPAVRPEDLVIARATAEPGPSWKRFRAGPFGRAMRVLKRTSHVTVELERK